MSTETVPKGYKRTEVGVIPEEWDVKSLRSLSEKIMVGIASAATHAYRATGIVMFRNQNIRPGIIDDSDLLYIAEEYERIFKNKRLKNGDLLTARTGYPGTTSLVPEKYEGAQSFTTLITRLHANSVAPVFLCYLMNSRIGVNYFEQTQIGGAQKNVNASSLKDFPVCLPPTLAEQEAIATALSDADALIESLEQLIAKKRQIKQGAMQELLTGKRRLPGFTGKWEARKIGAIGSTYGGLTGKTKADFEVGTARYVTFMSVMKEVRINPASFGKVRVGENESQNKVLQGDLIFNGSSETPEEVALCALLEAEIENLYLNSFCFGFRIREENQVSGLYLAYYIRSREGRELMKALAQGSTRYNMSKPALMDSSIIIPSLPEQTAIASVLSDMDTELEALEAKLGKARKVKQGMMQLLLTGKVRLVSTQPKETEVPFLVAAEPPTSKAHNLPFNEAVLISVLAGRYGTSQFPLSRFRYTKFLYLFHRHVDHVAQGFRKKAAGPYNPDNRYKGPETIAQKSEYMVRSGSGFVAGPKNPDALRYFEKWYPLDHLEWLDRFRFAKNDALEVLTTVDMSCEDLRIQGKAISVQTVKTLIESEPEWLPKLEREIFSDTGIAAAIRQSQELFGGNSA